MITKNLVDASNVEAKQQTQLEQLDKIQIAKDILPEDKEQPTLRNVIFKLTKKKRGKLFLDNCCDNVKNPDNGNIPERIWLLNGAHSIWDSKLENILKDKDRYGRARRGRDIIFIDGVCRVPADDTLYLEFMRKNRHNIGDRRTGSGKYDFYEYSPQKEQEDRLKKQMLKIEMVIKAKDMPIEQAKKLASFFGIAFVDELGVPKSDEAIKTELMLKADTDPSTFQKYIDSREVEVSYLVRRALIESKIDLGGESRNATWANGRGFIAKIPFTRKPLEYLTELAMTNSDDGRRFLEQLNQNIK